jgi:hypothetical protein
MTGKVGDPCPAVPRTGSLPETEPAPAASPDRTVTITNTSAYYLNARRYEARSLRTGPSRAPRATWRRQGSAPARAEPLHHEGAQLVTDRIGVPVRGAQQPLHPIRGDLAAANEAERQVHAARRIRVEHGISHLTNWRALSRHLGRREHLDAILRAVAGLISSQERTPRLDDLHRPPKVLPAGTTG